MVVESLTRPYRVTLSKQHYILDVIAGILLASVGYVLFLQTHSREAVSELDRRVAPAMALLVLGIIGIMTAGYWMVYEIQRMQNSEFRMKN
jgi:hypothetical protein